jgi:long-subunit fatty acid transport protein
MTKIILVSLFLFVSGSVLFSQTDGPAQSYSEDNIITQSHDYYSLNYLSAVNAGKGVTGIASDGDIMSASLNPASLKLNKKYQVYVSYAFKDNVNYNVLSVVNDVVKQSHPSASFGIGYKLNKDFQIGFVYRNDRSMKLDFNFTGGKDVFSENFLQHTFSVPVTFDYKFLRFGTNLNLILLHGSTEGVLSTEIYPEGLYTISKANSLRFIPDFGIKINPVKLFSFGISFTPGSTFDNEWTHDNPAFRSSTTHSHFPMKVGTGVEFRTLNERLKFTGEYKFVQTSVINDTKDRNDVNLGIDFKANEKLSLRAGMFTFLQVENTVFSDGRMDQYFLTVGASYLLNNFGFHFSAVSSSIIKKTEFSHSIFNLAVSYDI